MTKQIKVSDETYEKLKFLADEGYRTLGGEIDYLIAVFGGDIVLPVSTTPLIVQKEKPEKEEGVDNFVGDFPNNDLYPEKISSPVRPVIPRTYRTVHNEITALELQLKEEKEANEVNQDPDYWADFNKRSAQVKELWAEYHLLKGDA